MSVSANGARGPKKIAALHDWPGGIGSLGVFGAPTGSLVPTRYPWKLKDAGVPVTCVIPQVMASTPESASASLRRAEPEGALAGPVLWIVARTVAVVPTGVVTRVGRTVALRTGGGGQLA